MAEARASVSRKRRISPIWFIPIVAVLLGLWMVYYTWANEGPTITIHFSTAEGLEAGKTKVKARSVVIGVVESVRLSDDLESVVVEAKLEPSARPLLREDSQLWVVRARIGASGVTGLSTVLSGGYVELEPGQGEPGRREFIGLENPPVTPVGTPGLRLTLRAARAGSVGTGDVIYYKGYEVGRIESTEFDVEKQELHYGAFIEAPYNELVTTSTRFWNASGLSFSATADGIQFSTGSLRSLLLGGVAFGLPDGVKAGDPARDGAVYELFEHQEEIDDRPYEHSIEYVVEFARSVRGLRPGAPVEYRGLPAGKVERIMVRELVEERVAGDETGSGAPIPVLVRLEPGRLEFGDSERGVDLLKEAIRRSVTNGMRATLATGNLLTGSLYVALDLHDDEEPATMGEFAGRPTIPTTAGGLAAIEDRVAKLLDKLNALPLDDVTRTADATLSQANETLAELRRTVAEMRLLLASDEFQDMPRSIDQSLTELDRTLRSVNDLARSLEEQPSAIVFPRSHAKDPVPPAGSP